jgi:hypothetical protein
VRPRSEDTGGSSRINTTPHVEPRVAPPLAVPHIQCRTSPVPVTSEAATAPVVCPAAVPLVASKRQRGYTPSGSSPRCRCSWWLLHKPAEPLRRCWSLQRRRSGQGFLRGIGGFL